MVGIDNSMASIGAAGASPNRKEEKTAMVGIGAWRDRKTKSKRFLYYA